MLPCANNYRLATFILSMLVGSSIDAQETRWIIRGGGVYAATAGDESVSIATLTPPLTQERTTNRVSEGAGFGVGLEYLLTPRVGLEIATLFTYHDSDVVIVNDLGSFTATDSIGLKTFTLGAKYQFSAQGRALWSVGGYLALTFSDDVTLNFPALGRTDTLSFDQDYGLGVKAGVGLPFAPGSSWTFSIEGRYMFTILESEAAGSDLDLNPVVLSLSVGYRF